MPNTTNRGYITPNTGDLVGAWGTAALNPNFVQLDGVLGGVATISLSSATTFSLSASTTAITPSAGPYQSDNALIKFTGTLTGNSTIRFSIPGFYIVDNRCTGDFYVRLSPSSGTGNSIGAPPGQKVHVFFDGSAMDYVDTPPVGSAMDLHTNTTTLPPWMTACTVAPYLIKNGATYSSSVYPALAALLGSTYGGNGASTFGVPDEMNRVRVAIATAGNIRLTAGISGVSGTTFGAAGGSEQMQAHTHTVSLNDPGHRHTLAYSDSGSQSGSGGLIAGGTTSVSTASTGITVSIATSTQTGTAGNVQPTIINFLPLVKT